MVLGQSKMFEKPAIGVAHFLIFWGFIILTLYLAQVLLDGILGRIFPLPIIGSRPYIALNDILAVAVLVALAYALYRRLRIRPWHLTTLPDAFVIIAMISGHLSRAAADRGLRGGAVRERGGALVAGRGGAR